MSQFYKSIITCYVIRVYVTSGVTDHITPVLYRSSVGGHTHRFMAQIPVLLESKTIPTDVVMAPYRPQGYNIGGEVATKFGKKNLIE